MPQSSKFLNQLSYFRSWIIVCVFWSIITGLFMMDFGSENVRRRIEVLTRQYIGESPKLSPKLKILLYDDVAIKFLKKPDLSYENWALILKAISKNKPKAIYFDKMFSLFDNNENIKPFTDHLTKSNIPTSAGVVIRSNVLQGRNDVTSIAEKSNLDQHYLNQVPVKEGKASGAIKELASKFDHLGHIIYHDRGRTKLFWKHKDKHFIKHLALTHSKIELKKNGVYVNGHWASNLNKKSTAIDILPLNSYYESNQVISIAKIVHYINNKKPLDFIKPGDSILIAMAFTGSTDFLRTPVDTVPGSLFVSSIINSTITGKWLFETSILKDYYGIPILLVCLLFAFIGSKLSIIWSLLLLASSTMMIIAGSIFLFIYSGWVIEWDYLSSTFFLGGLGVISDRALWLDRRAKSYKIALSKTVPKDRLKEVFDNPESAAFQPRYQNVTVMFVDIAKFSSIAEKRSAEEVFGDLKTVLNNCIKTIHSQGGVVDKTLGDGILAYFGYEFNSEESKTNHADAAIKCAIAMQKNSCHENITRTKLGHFPFVLRIGLNSSNVFIGNIGDHKIPEITIIGRGVNYAQRLEAACEEFKILLSNTTKEKMSQDLYESIKDDMSTQHIQIKHYKEKVEVWQVDPVSEFVNVREKIMEHFANKLKSEASLDKKDT